jgi:hypothetical protein
MEMNSGLIIVERDRSTIRTLALDSIVLDDSVQARVKMMAVAVVDEYAEAMRQGAAFPPIDVFQDGDTYLLCDGFTRHAAAKCAGLTEIGCVVHVGDLRDAKLFAVGVVHDEPDDQADGLKLTRAEATV